MTIPKLRIIVLAIILFSGISATLNSTVSENIAVSSEKEVTRNFMESFKLRLEDMYHIEYSQADEENQRLPFRWTNYRPIYFINALQVNEKFPNYIINFSFKYRIIKDLDLFFGYTQLMFWDQDKDSSPFKDINYNPELFYRFYIKDSLIKSINLGFYEHKSNGLAGDNSRSLNRQYLQLHSELTSIGWFNLPSKISWDIKYFKLWEGSIGDNPDIGKYLGNLINRIGVEDYLIFGPLTGTELYAEFYAGGQNKTDFSMGGIEIGYIFNCRFWGLSPRVYIQAFNGYGHSLLQYNQNEHSIRMGLIII